MQNNHVFYEVVGLNTQKTNVPMCLSIICTYLLFSSLFGGVFAFSHCQEEQFSSDAMGALSCLDPI